MTKTRSRILFVVHSCNKNGATTSLVNLLEELLKDQGAPQVTVLLMNDGMMSENFYTMNIKVLKLHSRSTSRWSRLLDSARNMFTIMRLRYSDFNIVVGNTCVAVPIIRKICTARQRVFLWIHELEFGMVANLGFNWKQHFLSTDTLLSCGPSVTKFLENELCNRILELGECVNFGLIEGVRRKSNSNQIVVAMVGTLNWRKGADLFLQVAHAMKKSEFSSSVVFHWIGGPQSQMDLLTFQQNMSKMGLNQTVKYIGEVSDTADIYSNVNALFLSSYEDPNPLVVLEAAWIGIPTISMAESGGAPIVTEFSGGFICGFRDIAEIVDSIESIVKHQHDNSLHSETKRRLLEAYSPAKVVDRFCGYIST